MAGAAYGAIFLCMALFSMASLRGKPVLLDNRWLSIPGTWFTVFYLWVSLSSDAWESWGLVDEVGMAIGVLVATLSMLAAALVFPTNWGGLVLLGVDRAEVRHILKHVLRDLDPGAKLKKELWYSELYAADVQTTEILGQSVLRICFSGAGAGELSSDMLPLLRHDFAELGLAGGEESMAFARRVLWFFVVTLIGLMLLAWFGYSYSHSLREV